MPNGVIASSHPMTDWEPRDKDLKRYIHFDRDIPRKKITSLANDPTAVATHAFFPLLRFYEEWTKFRKGAIRKKKARPLRFASRVDAAIYARYRASLADLYEAELAKRGLSDIPVAYRRLPKEGGGNKCNIDIARDVFAYVRDLGDCIVTVVDIKSYFESLDHKRIKDVWELLLGRGLPSDHLAVFNSITKYSIVDLEALSKRLNLNERVPQVGGNRRDRRKRNIDALKDRGKKQICSTKDFRELVAGTKTGFPSLIQKNGFDFGIPQGTPISDLVANFYLIDFDQEVSDWVSVRSGMYRRYSDDIVIVLPNSSVANDMEAKEFLQKCIRKHGAQLRIQDRKVCVVKFERTPTTTVFKHLYGSASRNGLEYLGFEYNGHIVKLKNSTLSNAWRKIKRRSYGHASRFVKRYRDKGVVWLQNNYPGLSLETKMLRDVTYNQDIGFETWTFVKYVRRASRSFIGFNPIFSKQTKRYRKYTRIIIADAFRKALNSHA
ncbi:hypothetical protein F4695_000171 [Rhizobium soli]|uniref:Reverse transcriptase domain-containing protein n=1 Tax=Rhizobium soli TaxID=424798 RepID=A0A7X0MPK9_9HYPH|nr:hypothetical protein [Rhizobium soli]MBB6506852.1 hypothetical protein [Rhizobium soli]